MAPGPHVHLERPPGGERNGNREGVVDHDVPPGFGIGRDELATEASCSFSSVLIDGRNLGDRCRWQERQRVDLAMGMAQRCTHLDTVVLERHDVVVALRPQRRAAVAPEGDDPGHLGR